MKNIITTLFAMLIIISSYAQVPGIGQMPMGINYQAVARDTAGELIVNDDVNIRFKVLDGSATGTELFTEQQIATTNEFGLFNLIIGSVNTTDFSNIEWRTADRFLEVDLFQGGTWTNVGTQQIMAVPYATVAGNGKTKSSDGQENIYFYGANGSLNINAGVEGDSNHGRLSVYDENGEQRGQFFSSLARSGAGTFHLFGENGNYNISIGANPGVNDNHGRIYIHDANGTSKAYMLINSAGDGVINADNICANVNVCANIKNFRMDHPTRPDKEIWYACIEGPEAAAYERGTAQLINGEATIQFSEHFELVLNHTTMTVTLTPLDANAKGLAVIEKTATGFKVKELNGGTGNYSFDWRAEGVRRGFEDYEVIRDKAKMQEILGETPR